jgi:hypothetical protein
MESNEMDEQARKASCSIDDNIAPVSNATMESLSQSEKHRVQMISTEAGIQIDERE